MHWTVQSKKKHRRRYRGYRQDVQGLVHMLRAERSARSARRQFEKGMNPNYAGDAIAYERLVQAERDAHRSVRLRKMKIHELKKYGRIA